uniref:Putative secreted protein n=1 Tax=Ixodes ricinus TaxID=34613 RepID=A0A6B0TYN0_IXORI
MPSLCPWVLACRGSSARCRRCWLAKVRRRSAWNSSHDGINASWFSYQVRAVPCKAKYTFRRRCSAPHPLNRVTRSYWLNKSSTFS